MNVHELKATGLVLFDKEYWAWVALQGADCGWWEHIEEDFKETMQLLGVEVAKVYFNLGYGQSDYASFTGYIDFGKWLEIAGGMPSSIPCLPLLPPITVVSTSTIDMTPRE